MSPNPTDGRRYLPSDYPLLLDGVKYGIANGEKTPLSTVVLYLHCYGINCFGFAVTKEQWATDFDRDIGKAWKECGTYKAAKPPEGN